VDQNNHQKELKQEGLGFLKGTQIWMEEIISRYYANNIQGLVYLGAMVLLVFVGCRFAGIISEKVALIGIGIEAVMLLVLGITLFYTPEEETPPLPPPPVNLEKAMIDLKNALDSLARDGLRQVATNMSGTLESSVKDMQNTVNGLALVVTNITGALNSTAKEFTETAKELTQVAQEIKSALHSMQEGVTIEQHLKFK